MSRKLLLILVLVVPPGIAAVATKSQHYPRRFAEVRPNALYRGGMPTPEHLRALAREKRIKTLVSLVDLTNGPECRKLVGACQAIGLRLVNVPMPGDGCGPFEDLDRAAEALGNANDWPIYFHCSAGKQRSNAALAAYRMKKCRWTIDQALAELEDNHGLDRVKERELVEHLREYARRLAAHPRPRPATEG